MPNRRVRVQRTAILGLLLVATMAMQGCLAMVWLGAVGIDSTRTSDIEFQSFENSWVGAPHERLHLASMKSIVVMPFAGDPVMAERWAVVLDTMTDLRVVSPSVVTRHGYLNVQSEWLHRLTDRERIGLAKRISAESHADCVLLGTVVAQEPKKSFVGLKERSSQRLYLHLVSAEGALMWKTELPFTIVRGVKELDEAMATNALLAHVKAQANELGLAELGTITVQAASRSLRDASDHQMAHPLSRFERP